MATTTPVAASLATKLRAFAETLTPPEQEALLELLQRLRGDVAGYGSTLSLFSFSFSSTTSTGGTVSSTSITEFSSPAEGDAGNCRLWLTLPDGQRLCVLYGE
jgi:hypothetical protein